MPPSSVSLTAALRNQGCNVFPSEKRTRQVQSQLIQHVSKDKLEVSKELLQQCGQDKLIKETPVFTKKEPIFL